MCFDNNEVFIKGENELDVIYLNIDYLARNDSSLDLNGLKEYLEYPELIIYSNNQRFDNSIFSPESITSYSSIRMQHIDMSQPNWIETKLRNRLV